MKVMMQGETVHAAAATTANAFTGERYERPPFDCIGNIYAAGTAISTGTGELNVGGVSVSGPANLSGANRAPLVPDDLVISDFEAEEGELLQFTVVSTAAFTVYWKVVLDEAEFEDYED